MLDLPVPGFRSAAKILYNNLVAASSMITMRCVSLQKSVTEIKAINSSLPQKQYRMIAAGSLMTNHFNSPSGGGAGEKTALAVKLSIPLALRIIDFELLPTLSFLFRFWPAAELKVLM